MSFKEHSTLFRSLVVQLLLLSLSTVVETLALSLAANRDGASWSNDATTSTPATATTRHIQTRPDAQRILDTLILRSVDKGQRLQLRDDVAPGMAVAGNDPSLSDTAYGEFPLSSLDALLDSALGYLPVEPVATATLSVTSSVASSSPFGLPVSSLSPSPTLTVVDLGSGCGRLALYMALTRPSWLVHGVEIAPALHSEACRAMHQAVQLGYLATAEPRESATGTLSMIATAESDFTVATAATEENTSRLTLHLGPAAEYTQLLLSADIIFCYSTAFDSSGFSEPASALILGRDWNDLLQRCCHGRTRNVICITTDKALDPTVGWTILDRINVPNPEVFESTGYIQQLREHSELLH